MPGSGEPRVESRPTTLALPLQQLGDLADASHCTSAFRLRRKVFCGVAQCLPPRSSVACHLRGAGTLLPALSVTPPVRESDRRKLQKHPRCFCLYCLQAYTSSNSSNQGVALLSPSNNKEAPPSPKGFMPCTNGKQFNNNTIFQILQTLNDHLRQEPDHFQATNTAQLPS